MLIQDTTWLISERKRFALGGTGNNVIFSRFDGKLLILMLCPICFFYQSGSWYKFNDEDIVKMQGKLKLSQDEDSAGM